MRIVPALCSCGPVLGRLAVAGGLALAFSLAAQAQDCRLALVLALDVSASVDRREYALQREGLSQALLAPEVLRLVLLGDPVALYAFEWANPSAQESLLPGWTLIESEADLVRVAAVLRSGPGAGQVRLMGSTALGSALDHAAKAFESAPPCRRRTLDLAGDGPNNVGYAPAVIYRSGRLDGVTVNALLIGGSGDDGALVSRFEAEVLRGPGAFWILADGYADYEGAMTAKLLRELAMPLVSESIAADHLSGREHTLGG